MENPQGYLDVVLLEPLAHHPPCHRANAGHVPTLAAKFIGSGPHLEGLLRRLYASAHRQIRMPSGSGCRHAPPRIAAEACTL